MKERPIIFNYEMVRAILEGRKTQTRRPVKPQPKYKIVPCSQVKTGWAETTTDDHLWDCTCSLPSGPVTVTSPYGKPGDRLWVRETWIEGHEALEDGTLDWNNDKVWYRATDDLERWQDASSDFAKNVPWRPSIHMPRRVSRITLEITDVRVEKIKDISEEDAFQELGIVHAFHPVAIMGPIKPFKELWDSIYASKNLDWEANPWVWVYEFRRVE